MASTEPVSVTLAEPLSVMLTPVVPAVAVSKPETTLSFRVTLLVPESPSATLRPRPLKVKAVCSVASGSVAAPVLVMLGASLTATTVTVRLMASEVWVALAELSVTVTEIWRAVVVGLSELLLNTTLRSTVW